MNYIAYIKERFPAIPLFLYTTATQIGINTLFPPYNFIKIVTISIMYLLFLLHLRIFDEFKDHEYDSQKYPNRPVQKGLITLAQLKVLGIINILLIAVLAQIIGGFSVNIGLYISLLYTFLMFKEFFIKEFLRKKITLYLISHEIVFIPLFVYFFSLFGIFIPSQHIPALLYCILPIILIEIGRKIKHRHDSSGNKTDDTYAFHWGEQGSILVFGNIVLLSGVLALCIEGYTSIVAIFVILSSLLIIFGSYFMKDVIVKYSMIITTFYALVLPLLITL